MGIAFYQHQKRGAVKAAQANLQVAHDLYTRQISYWRSQHLTLAHIIAADPRFRKATSALLAREQEASAAKQLRATLGALQRNYEYHALYVIDSTGNQLVNSGDTPEQGFAPFKCTDLCQKDIDLSLDLNEGVFSSIYLPAAARDNPEYKHLHMNLLLPLQLQHNGTEKRALLVMIIDPEAFLVPLLHTWPLPSESAEAILVRRHNDKIIRLTPPRFRSEYTLREVLPPQKEVAVGTLIQAGRKGFVTAQDYRQAWVLGRIASIPQTPWILVTKIDRREIMAPLKHTALYAGGAGASVIAFTGLLTLMWWRQHAYRYRNQILQRERENDALLQRLDNLSRYANDIILLCDHSGTIIDANDRALDAYGYTLDALRAMNIRELWDVEPSEWSSILLQLEGGEGVTFECVNQRADAEEFPVEISAGWIDAHGQRMMQAIIRDISERKEAEDRLRHQAFYDDLTGLPNRSLATERLQGAIQRARRNNTQAALLFIDLDQFKHVNDTLGHVVGDQVLVLFAQRIEKVLGDNARAARFGADEFLLQVENVKSMADIISLVDKVVESIGEPVSIEGFEISATVSIGISIAPDDSTDVNQLIRYADTAMYRAKERGRNCYQFFTPDMHQRAEQRLSLEGALRRAVERSELILHYQPQVDMRSGEVIGCEALVRWQHPEQGLISPFEFISLAEEIGLIHEIGAWVVDEACRQIGKWQSEGYPELQVAVNVSPYQLQNKHLAQDILDTLMRHNLAPRTLEVEITETSLMLDTALAIAQMRDLSNGGVSLAIDDFGTGYSSLGHLHRFPIDKLKIDRSFVNNIDTSMEQGGETIPRAIISLAHELGLQVIAEGVENQTQCEFLLHAECIAGQGYLYSKPLPPEEFLAYLANSNRV
ncbi:MAG: EAL domain-containing protein [Desulfuromonadaceae bacterium]